MQKKIKGCFVALLICSSVWAQDKINFNSINIAGIARGKSGSYGVLQTVNGIKYREWFLGIGAGIDYYRNTTIPLFADLRTFIRKTGAFVFGDLGYNFPHHNEPGKNVAYYSSYDFLGGSYSELGLGYKFKLVRKSYLLFSTGYSYKKLSLKTGVINPCLVGPCPVDYSMYKYGYGRVVFKAGISF